MKKAMLFMIALLFSIGANAASINIQQETGSAYSSNVTLVGIVPNNASTSVASFSTPGGAFEAATNVSTDHGTWANVEWTFNPEGNFSGALMNMGDQYDNASGIFPDAVAITGDASYTMYMLAGTTYWFDLINASAANAMGFQLSVTALSQVPVPAALWLFAPALLGFFGLRRKSSASRALVAA